VPALVPITYLVLHGIAFLYYWPTLLALVARAAPPRVRSTMMGLVFVTLFLGNIIIGWLGSFYERMATTTFWSLHAVIAATGVGLVLACGRRLSRLIGAEGA
jgi:POT family proton-dependent oligopeptide transporter